MEQIAFSDGELYWISVR